MVRLGLVINKIGLILICIAIFMATSIFFSIYYKSNDIIAILLSVFITAGAGLLMYLLTPKEGEIGHKEGVLIVAFGWIIVSAFGALPFYLGGTFKLYTDAFFETMSGFTTTGASVLANIEAQPPGILFWRSLTHWLGGMGIIVMSLAILPVLGLGGMQLYKAEVPGPTHDKLVPRVRQTARMLWVVYSIITLAEVVLLLAGGLSLFDSLAHTFGTMGTGGFSPKNASVGAYNSWYVEMVITLFMFIAGANFLLHYRALMKGDLKGYYKDDEFLFYTGVVLFCTVTTIINLMLFKIYPTVIAAFRYAIFSVVSIVTTTGYVTTDFAKWPAYSHYILFILMFIGGCAGSTGGAIKCVRIFILLKSAYGYIFKLIHPKSVRSIRFSGKIVPPEIIQSIQSLFFLYIGIFVIASLFMAWLGLEIITAMSAVAATLGNVGPGLGAVGPVENYSHISIVGKWVLSLCMLLGRLEIYAVIIFLVPEFWRK